MKLVFATNNLNKLSEIRSLVPKGLQILSLDDINFSQEIPETQETLEGNALQKARYIFDNFGYKPGDFPVSEDCSKRIFSIPMHPYLTSQIQLRKLSYFWLEDIFDAVVTSEEVGYDKPDIRIFQLVLAIYLLQM